MPLGIISYTVACPLLYCRTLFESVYTISAIVVVLKEMQLQEKQVQFESHMQNFTCHIQITLKRPICPIEFLSFIFSVKVCLMNKIFGIQVRSIAQLYLIKEEEMLIILLLNSVVNSFFLRLKKSLFLMFYKLK